MSAKTIHEILRQEAIDRIKSIGRLFSQKNYYEIDRNSSEYDMDIQEYVDKWKTISLNNIHNWTNKMLSDYMDKPYFRYNELENYLVVEV